MVDFSCMQSEKHALLSILMALLENIVLLMTVIKLLIHDICSAFIYRIAMHILVNTCEHYT